MGRGHRQVRFRIFSPPLIVFTPRPAPHTSFFCCTSARDPSFPHLHLLTVLFARAFAYRSFRVLLTGELKSCVALSLGSVCFRVARARLTFDSRVLSATGDRWSAARAVRRRCSTPPPPPPPPPRRPRRSARGRRPPRRAGPRGERPRGSGPRGERTRDVYRTASTVPYVCVCVP